MARVSARWLLGRTRTWSRGAPPCAAAAGFEALAQRVHKVDDVGWRALLRTLDLLALLLAPEQIFERVLVLVLELLRLEVASFGLDDMNREINHVLGNLFVLDCVEIILFIAHLIRIAQGQAEQSFAARF